MLSYFTVALIISLICTLAIFSLGQAPARLRFYICILLLATWLTPWPLLQMQYESPNYLLPINLLIELPITQLEPVSSGKLKPVADMSVPSFISQQNILLLLLTIGLGLFIKDIASYWQLQKRWIKDSTLDNQLWQKLNLPHSNIEVRRIKTSAPGMATGLRKPIIWLSHSQTDSEKLRTIVLHELTHIRQHDPMWLWAINLVQRLCWWNPIVWFTARYAKQQIELSCDEQCKKHLPQGSYQQQLIKLTLEVNKQHHSPSMPAALTMSGTPAFNLQRIYKLNEDHPMKKRYLMVLAALLSLTGWIGFSNATINTQHMAQHSAFDKVLQSFDNNELSAAQSQLDSLVADIGNFDYPKQAKIWKLQAQLSYQLDETNPQIIAYMDNAIALANNLQTSEVLSLLNMAQALAASQERWDKQLSYADKWFEIAQGQNNNKLLYMSAVSHYSLQQFDSASNLLNKLVLNSEKQGNQPNENWLKLLMGTYMQGKNTEQAYAVQEKIARLYPTDKNLKLLNDLSYML